jgi:hypothetical protein
MRYLYRELDTYKIEELSQSQKRWDIGAGQITERARLYIFCQSASRYSAKSYSANSLTVT